MGEPRQLATRQAHATSAAASTSAHLATTFDLSSPLESCPGLWLSVAWIGIETSGLIFKMQHPLSTDSTRKRDWERRQLHDL